MEINYVEQGSPGLEAWSGFISKAYNTQLNWPGVYSLYNRLRRSDPEVTVVRQVFSTVAANVRIQFALPENPSDDDKKFVEFGEQVLDDLEGGSGLWRDTLISHAPFMGWAWWEAVPGLRELDWVPPGDDDPWRSRYNDGLIGFRRFAFRDHSAFESWDLSDKTGRLRGMWQSDPPNARVRLPLEQSIHIVLGDANNPEGLTPLEALWRLERIQYGYQVVHGIGAEHAAGHLSVTKTEKGDLTLADKSNIRDAARAILTAQEGNYAAWPFGFDGHVIDVTFSAADSILNAIRHYGTLKLALFNMQWIAMSTMSDTGSYAALKDSSALWLMAFNAMMEGAVNQLDAQAGARLLAMNQGAFPGITQRPKLMATKVEKVLDLPEVAAFMTAIKDVMPLGDDDFIEVRRRSSFLPETLPTEVRSTPTPGVVAPPTSGELKEHHQRARARFAQIAGRYAELSDGRNKSVYAELARSHDSVAAEYRDAVYTAILDYLVDADARSTGPKNKIKRAMVQAFPETFYLAYSAGGAEDVEADDDAWLSARIGAEIGHIDLLFQQLKAFKDGDLSNVERKAEATARADGYTRSLDGAYMEGLLRGQKNKMLTMVGDDGAASCATCRRNKGKRFSARKWLRLGIPGTPGNGWECGGYKCQHYLEDDEGARWSP